MKNRKINSTRIIALFFLLPMLITSCRFYHIRSHTVLYDNAKSLANNSKYPYLIIHSGTNYWQLHNPKITDNTLSGKLVSVNERVDYYYKLGLKKKNFQAPIADRFYQKQLHFYVDAFEFDGDAVTIPFEDITMIKSLDANHGLNTMSNIGIFGGSSIAAMGIFLAIACSCPHNYTYDGEHYHYNNTLFTGATAANLERHDYKSLPDYFPEQSTYKMLVKNEENEIQYTNLLEMIAVNHSKNVEVFTDQKGTIYTVADKHEAVEALNDAGESVANDVNYTDDQAYPFQQLGDDDFSHVYAKFNIEGSGANAKLIVRAKNSEWAGTVYHSFAGLLGKNYTKWVKHNQKRTPEEANQDVREAGIPLIVSIKQNGVWVNLDAIDLISEVNFNSLVIPVPQEMITASQVEIRVTSGYNFWQLDALHMDFSAPQSVSIEHISPTIAKGASDFTSALAKDDAAYMVHEITGDSTIIEFQAIPTASETRTLFLHSKGYYLSKDAYEGATNWQAVMALKQAGGLSFFSKALYESYLNMTKND